MNLIQFIIVLMHFSVIVDVTSLSATSAKSSLKTKNTKVVVKGREVLIVMLMICITRMILQRWKNRLPTDIKLLRHVWQRKSMKIVITNYRIWSFLLIKPFSKVRFSHKWKKTRGNIQLIAVIATLNSGINRCLMIGNILTVMWRGIVNGLCHGEDLVAWKFLHWEK